MVLSVRLSKAKRDMHEIEPYHNWLKYYDPTTTHQRMTGPLFSERNTIMMFIQKQFTATI
jgi:hypothetical protein